MAPYLRRVTIPARPGEWGTKGVEHFPDDDYQRIEDAVFVDDPALFAPPRIRPDRFATREPGMLGEYAPRRTT